MRRPVNEVGELQEAIVEAVAELDQCDGSRISQNEAIDSARNILQTAYGDDLDDDVEELLRSQEDEEEILDEDADGDGIPDDEQED